MRSPHWQQRLSGYLVAAAVLLALTGAAAAEGPADDPGQLLAAAKAAVDDGRMVQSKLVGFNLGKPTFTESPADSGFLVGFEVGLGKFFNTEVVYAVRAIYLTPRGEEVLEEHGIFHDSHVKNKIIKTKVLHTVRVRALAGYAVGGVTLRTGLLVNGLSATFMRINGQTLDPQHTYESDWVGDRTGGSETTIGGDGAPVVGTFGSQDDEKISAFGLYFMAAPAHAVVAPALRPAEPTVEKPVDKPADSPKAAPPKADPPAEAAKALPPAEAPQQAAEPAAAAATIANTPAAPKNPPAATWAAYGVPVGVFGGVTVLIFVLVLAFSGRKEKPAKSDYKEQPRSKRRPVAPIAPSQLAPTTLCAQPVPRKRSPADTDEVWELRPEHYVDSESAPRAEKAKHPRPEKEEVWDLLPEHYLDAEPAPRAERPKAQAASPGGWPRLEL